jgi:hypothetical protein
MKPVSLQTVNVTKPPAISRKGAGIGVLQRKCACGGTPGPTGECEACRQRREAAMLQRSASHASVTNLAPPLVHEVIAAPGQPLDTATRALMETRFGHDFSGVRVHSDAKSAASARAVNAQAYTVGTHLAFAESHYQPATAAGRRLIAHELTHVVQQRSGPLVAQQAPLTINAPNDPAEREAERVADALDQQSAPQPISERPPTGLARKALNIDSIAADTENFAATMMPIPMTLIRLPLLFLLYGGHASGEIAKAADYPTSFTLPADKSKPVAKPPKADAKPPLSTIPVEAHFFPTIVPAKGRALVVGGFHGDEQPGWQITDALVNELIGGGKSKLAFNTIIVPRLNAAAIADELAGVKMWRNRCNRQLVDLNRNFPTGSTPKDTDCVNTVGAPIQPEVQALMDIITKFKPDRIVSTHAITNPASAGIFADPNQDPQAIELARGMASTLVNPSDRPKNRLGPGVNDFNPVYPGDKPGVVGAGTSLGAWAPTAIPGRTTPVVTLEAPEFKPLGSGPGSAPRTVEGFLRPLRAFLGDPADLATAADRDILADIDAFNAADRIAFLTGALPSKNAIYQRIRFRIDTAIAKLNAMKPPKPIKVISWLRLSSESLPGASSQAQIFFEKLFLTGDKATKGWDTLPDQFFKNGKRGDGVDRAKWLATPYKDRIAIILQFSSLPGVSRHHWATEVDLNSTEVADWQPATASKPEGAFFALGQWLQANASKVGLIQSFTAGRSGGYHEEAWHYSYAPISLGLRTRYNQQVSLQTDVIDKVMAEFRTRAKAAGQTGEADFEAALKQINISDLVNNIGPGL